MEKNCRKIIEWGFSLLFGLIPLVFYAGSYELFEYNKMVLVYGLTIIIIAAWLILLVSNFKFQISNWLKSIPRTPLDIPILLYLLAHILSTIFSLDPHVSIWGYYSRFHEGLLATISYILLYYAAVSNLRREHVVNLLKMSFISAAIVSVYGAFEHFGHSPSCLFITGNFNVDCWVQDVKNRVFATLGQPNWMAAYLDIVLLTSIGLLLQKIRSSKDQIFKRSDLFCVALTTLFFAGLLFTKSRSGILGLLVGSAVFSGTLIWGKLKSKELAIPTRPIVTILLTFCLAVLLFGLPFSQTEKFSLKNLLSKPPTSNQQPATSNQGYIDIGISESGDIRRIVWKGAIKIWQRYPIFGSGVETFAYAYYKDRPVEHNMVSEWDFLYNKAHNEFLNILATTGTVGFLSYLSILGTFSLWFIKLFKNYSLEKNDSFLTSGLFAAWTSILVTNFFGFSVVVIGLFFFLIPAFSFILAGPEAKPLGSQQKSSWLPIVLIVIIALVMEWNLISMWRADKSFAYGKNLDSIQRFADAYKYLTAAVSANPDEPTFRDELSYNQATLASEIFTQIQSSSASAIASLSAQQKLAITIPALSVSTSELIRQAIDNSNKVVETSPNALTFAKTRTKVFYTLSTIDNKYILESLAAIKKAAELAPTDAKIHYNLAILYGRAGQITPAITTLEETIAMKKDYRDAYYALGLYYKETGNIQKAKATMQQILTLIGPDPDATKWLQENK